MDWLQKSLLLWWDHSPLDSTEKKRREHRLAGAWTHTFSTTLTSKNCYLETSPSTLRLKLTKSSFRTRNLSLGSRPTLRTKISSSRITPRLTSRSLKSAGKANFYPRLTSQIAWLMVVIWRKTGSQSWLPISVLLTQLICSDKTIKNLLTKRKRSAIKSRASECEGWFTYGRGGNNTI